FLVAENAGGTVEILDAAGEPLVALPARTRPAAVVAALEHLARYRNVQELENKDPKSDLYDKLAVSLERPPGPERFPKLPPAVRPGDWVRLSIQNNSVQELNIAVLNLQADWSIRQAYPNAAFLPLDSGAVERIPFEVRWPFRLPRGRDLFKIFAVSGYLDCRWLELPALGEPPLPPPGDRGSLAPGSLTDLFAALTGEPPPVRALVPERQPEHSWTVADLVIEVSR
ncbi:MAG TPA: hypothetical protein VEL74_21345, partial [Thermoanaerobaculia bacterium]|nr:hypothetical protein [Thermoanaerobaculia bacterium]